MYEVDSTCMSQCNNCGALCAAFPITDLTSLELYKSHQCSVVTGDLYITGLAVEITRTVLLSGLATIRIIRGSLYIENNAFLAGMTFFSGLESIQGDVYYLNNPAMMDARMPSLTVLYGNTTVIGCDRLCPARYTQVGYRTDDAGCTNMQMEYYLHVAGSVTVADLETISSIFTRVVQATTSFAV